MIETVVALLMIINGEIKEHRIQIDPDTGKHSMAMCLKGKRIADRGDKGGNITKEEINNNQLYPKFTCIPKKDEGKVVT